MTPAPPAAGRATTALTGRSLRFLSLLLVVEAAMYATVAPLLSDYVSRYGLTGPAAGVLVGAYTAGLVLGALAAQRLCRRFGVRPTAVAGMGLLAATTVCFGLASSVGVLVVARACQGGAAGMIWTAVLAWIIEGTSGSRRGSVVGGAVGAATFGLLAGPLVGTLAAAIGATPVFCGAGALLAVLGGLTLCVPAPGVVLRETARPSTSMRVALRDERLRTSALVLFTGAAGLGAVNTLVPLRLDELGVSAPAVGLIFVGAALMSAACAPLVGAMSDRRGPAALMLLGLPLAAAVLVALALLPSAAMVAILTVAFSGAVTCFDTPAAVFVTESSEGLGAGLAAGTTLVNIGFASGQTVGAPLAAVVQSAISEAAPMLGLAALLLIGFRRVLAMPGPW